jgi:hypothetical protein
MWRPGFDPRSVYVKSTVNKVALGQVFFVSGYFGFPLSVSFNQCSILIFIYMLLFRTTNWLNKGTFQKAILFRKFATLDRKILSLFFFISNG